MMEAVILAGGIESRLRSVVSNLPKPMALVEGRPFLEYVLNHLDKSGVFSRVTLSVGYLGETIKRHFGERFGNLAILYSEENMPLGTGGATILALQQVSGKNFFLINGDSLFFVDFRAMLEAHIRTTAQITIAVKELSNVSRYGTVELSGHKIVNFHEKALKAKAKINGGVYLFERDVFKKYKFTGKFSLETDFLEKHLSELSICGFESQAYFIDIGIPEDYAKFQNDVLTGSIK